jgi:putative membrane protein
MREETILRQAEFDPRLKAYSLFQSTLLMLLSIVAWPLLPFWVLGLGYYVARRQYEALDCALTERSLNFSKGIIVKVQKNVPLDKITDLALHEGPILRALGLTCLKVETAGQSAAQSALLSLVGIQDSLAFRDAVLNQRDRIVATGSAPAPASDGGSPAVLTDIRDTLGRIEGLMRERPGSGA